MTAERGAACGSWCMAGPFADRRRDTVLPLAHEKSPLQYGGNAISYPDFMIALQAPQREFIPAKKLLQKSETSYVMLYPAKLRIMSDGKAHVFTDAKLALKFSKSVNKKCSPLSDSTGAAGNVGLSDID
ncbi:hypothetical protein NDU88_004503 [Pleurodeles waltl]|uniref:Uncharacterized protein n=1 Tax=Pleurodeles waltl TaxID=8319 RepID=A0AAV7MV35_PLEWA|nr:hypothetical protein NDU88_004503 [Pleurodeles waltl]